MPLFCSHLGYNIHHSTFSFYKYDFFKILFYFNVFECLACPYVRVLLYA